MNTIKLGDTVEVESDGGNEVTGVIRYISDTCMIPDPDGGRATRKRFLAIEYNSPANGAGFCHPHFDTDVIRVVD